MKRRDVKDAWAERHAALEDLATAQEKAKKADVFFQGVMNEFNNEATNGGLIARLDGAELRFDFPAAVTPDD